MKQIGRILVNLALVITLGCLLGMLGFSIWDKMPTPINPVTWSPNVRWIEPLQPSYRLYARQTLYLTDDVQGAWLRLSADNSFILYVNGKQLGRQLTTSNSSLSFASRNTFPNQDINDSAPYRVRLENRFIGYPHNWKQSFYVDLSKDLHAGKNVIALEVQKAQKSVRVAVEGYIYGKNGAKPLNLTTGEARWKVSTLAENHHQISWLNPNFPDESWVEAKVADVISEKTFSRVSQTLYDRILTGSWITGNESNKGEFWMQGMWDIPQTQGRSFIRFAGDGEYSLLINDHMIQSYQSDDKNQLHLFEVTNLIKKGQNILSVRLAKPFDTGSSIFQNKPLSFFLDGWLETPSGEIVSQIATDTNWKTSSKPNFQINSDALQDRAIALNHADPREFDRRFEGNAYLLNYPDFLWRNSLWQLLGIGLAVVYAWLLGRVGLGYRGGMKTFSAGTALMLPGTLFLIGMGLIKHRYAESEQGLIFAQPSTNMLILLGFISIQVFTLFWSFWLNRGASILDTANSDSITHSKWNRLSKQFQLSSLRQWIPLIIIILVGFGLRAYNLEATARDSDENTSLDAIRGILRTGAPVATSGIWYTRGPLYHYAVALWLKLVGYSSENARFSSVIFGTITLAVAFFIARKFTGKVWLALLITAILAIDPWELAISRNTRFYQFLQMNVMFSFWFFAKGFIFKEGRTYQNLFFVSTLALLLTQEGYVTLLPCFLIGFLCFYRPFSLKQDWSIVLGSIIMMSIFAFNIIFFLIRCLTPPVGISSGSSIQIKLHLGEITGFAEGFLVGNSRINILYSLFFLLGFAYFLIKKNGKLIFLFSSVCIFLLSITLLVIQISPRYTFGIYPLFVILSIYSAFCILGSLGRSLENAIHGLLPLRAIALCSVILLLASNLEPSRVLAGYQEALARQNPQLFEYVQQHLQPEDVVVANLPAAAAITLGKLDYFLPSQGILSLDGFYLDQGRLIDRWAGGQVINSVDQFIAILEKSNRVWIQLDDNPQPNEPNQRQLYDYVRSLGHSVFEPYGVRLRLWQKADGILPKEINQGKDLGNY